MNKHFIWILATLCVISAVAIVVTQQYRVKNTRRQMEAKEDTFPGKILYYNGSEQSYNLYGNPHTTTAIEEGFHGPNGPFPYAVFSRDGTQILSLRQHEGRQSFTIRKSDGTLIYEYPLNLSAPAEDTNAPIVISLALSPDNAKIAYILGQQPHGSDGSFESYTGHIIDTQSNETQTIPLAEAMIFGATSDTIYFLKNKGTELIAYDLVTQSASPLTNSEGIMFNITLSPDGSMIAFVETVKPSANTLPDVDFTKDRLLTYTFSTGKRNIVSSDNYSGALYSVQWTLDSKSLYAVESDPNVARSDDNDIVRYDLETTKTAIVLEDCACSTFVVAPDNSALAYLRKKYEGNDDIYIVKLGNSANHGTQVVPFFTNFNKLFDWK